jgi:hypothetical protein
VIYLEVKPPYFSAFGSRFGGYFGCSRINVGV